MRVSIAGEQKGELEYVRFVIATEIPTYIQLWG